MKPEIEKGLRVGKAALEFCFPREEGFGGQQVKRRGGLTLVKVRDTCRLPSDCHPKQPRLLRLAEGLPVRRQLLRQLPPVAMETVMCERPVSGTQTEGSV